jgi:hypothetical protein
MDEQYYSRILPLSGIKSPNIQLAHDYWLTCRGEREMPARADLRPEEMKGFLGTVSLVDVHADPLDFRYSLFGTVVAEEYGFDMTGKSARTFRPPEIGALIWSLFEEAHQARMPRLHAVGFESATQRLEFERLILPLSSDGGHIDKFMSVNEHLKKFSRELEEELEEKAVIRFSAA